ncbi:tetraacyldisaccharide 4'-kinase [Fibrobacter sp. UBA2449]|uniref:tetraacyldisaccharide 4'-kinase n=1 Tax=Fibrobacter sp. UBA2449 TaxID=1946529 RepID=UPI0025BDDA32|nr:tetraacyldisaccharide 4'-kinase [Fibrobacter sp. UBA2449]
MNTLTRFPLTCLAACYHAAYRLHHRLCLKPGQPLQNSSLYVIGSFRIGGAGKSPFTAWFVRFLREQGAGRIAVLCHAKARDEAQMLRQRLAQLPQVQVFSTGNRYRTAHELDGEFDAIVCDDGFEDTRLSGAIVIRLDWEDPPVHTESLVPAGMFRSMATDHAAPAIALRCASTHTGADADVTFGIAGIENAAGNSLSRDPVLLCGIADPSRFASDVAASGIRATRTIALRDHDRRLRRILEALLRDGEQVVITEKDFARLPPELQNEHAVFIARQRVLVSDSAKNALIAARANTGR